MAQTQICHLFSPLRHKIVPNQARTFLLRLIDLGDHFMSVCKELMVKNPPANAGDMRDVRLIPMRCEFDPWSGRSPGGGHGKPLQDSCLENPHGQRSLVDCSPWGLKELDTTERLSIHKHWICHDRSSLRKQLNKKKNKQEKHCKPFRMASQYTI